MAEFPRDVAESIKHIEGLIKQMLNQFSSNSGFKKTLSGTGSTKDLSPKEIEKMLKKQSVLKQEINARQEKANQMSEELNSLLKKTENHLNLSKSKKEQLLLISEKQIELDEIEIKLLKEKYKIQLQNKELSNKEIIEFDERIERLEKELEERKQISKVVENDIKSTDTLRSSTSDLLSKVTGLSLAWQEMASVKVFKNFGDVAKTQGFLVAIKSVGKGIYDVLRPASLLGNMFSGIVDTFRQTLTLTDALRASFNQATGTTGEYTEKILSLRSEYSEYVVDIRDSFEAYQTLMTQMSLFRDLDASLQKQIAGHALLMDKLGISYSDTAEFIQVSTMALGLNHSEAIRVQGQLVKLADQMKTDAGSLIKSYNSSIKSLSMYGDKGIEVFGNLSKFADKAGLSINTLLQMTQKFNSFENAASSVGQLNAMLGGSYLSTIDMLDASDDERIKKIKESIDLAGIQFNELGKFQKLYITQTLGLENVSDAAQLLSGSMSDLDAKLSEQNLTQKEAEKRAQSFATVTQKLEAIFQNIVFALEPIIDLTHFLVDLLSKAVVFVKENAVVFGILFGVLAIGTIILKTLGVTLFSTAAASTAAASATAAHTAAATASVAPLGGMSMALLGVGLSVGLAAAGIALIVFSLKEFLKVAMKAPESLIPLSVGMALFAASLIVLGATFPLALAGMFAMGLGFAAMGVGLLLVSNDDIVALADVFEGLASVFDKFNFTVFDQIVSGIKRIADAADDVDQENLFSIGYVFKQMGEAVTGSDSNFTQIQSSASTPSKATMDLDKLVQDADRLSVEINQARTNINSVQNEKIVSIIKENKKNQTGMKTTEKIPEIVVKIGEREIFRLIEKYINEKASLSRT